MTDDSGPADAVVIERTFDAPPALVIKLAAHLHAQGVR